ncbi:cytochrome P450 [Microvirga arsenatis]|uniref:Cytochrome P450 n=1 Tax=Microvirga arsenatis TaxID=2692265 RepID=A0ABW9YSI1_9HYPH|nr:cytochrome P450 [Microvirga arsenatis]NBJ10078.1 cytochrome P450 [Microvirga arsenatis]NBJ23146.1 cytochrome P450 [Microvirga arsenatis]
MSIDALPRISEQSPGVTVSRRSPIKVIPALVRDPLRALPPEIYREPLVYSRVAGRERILLSDPALIHEALVRNADALSKGEDVRRALGPALGQGLLTADGAHWRWQRQSVAPAFRHEKLVGLLPAMIAAAERTRDRWLSAEPGAAVRIGHEMMRTTFDIIVDTMMSGPGGIDVAQVEKGITDYLKPTGWIFALSLLSAPEWLPYPGRSRARSAALYLRSEITRMIAERRASHDEREDLVSLLLAASDPETGRTMTDGEIADNLLTFMTAGHETTALGLAWTLLLLARHSQHEEKVVAEIKEVTGGGPVRPEHIAKLAYTRQVFSEAMRLYPPAPIITRTAVRSFPLQGFTVPAGAVIVVPIHAVHHHAALWEDPERFDPGRFSTEQVKGRHRYAYMPFGAGPRVCIGSAFATMEAVAILAVLLQSVRLHSQAGSMPAPLMRVTLRPRQDPELLVERR